MKNILFIHQSAELYGSDKTLLLLLKNLDKSKFNPVVILPSEGLLKIELEKENIKVVIAPVLKLYRDMLSPKKLINFIKEVKSSVKILDRLNELHKFDIVYSNTLAVLLGLIYAKKRKIKHIWHVHEIIVHPRIIASTFPILLQKYADIVVCNSLATKENLVKRVSKLDNKTVIIYNGVPENKTIAFSKKEDFGYAENDIIITLVGRISRLKGHKWLLKTYIKHFANFKNVKLLFVGSPVPNQEFYLHEIEEIILKNNLIDSVKIIPFTVNLQSIWAITDIAVMPSTEAESFGLVAVEAMYSKKPVVGSNHGGLKEIILNNETGYLIEPNNEQELATALKKLVESENLRTIFGKKGNERATKKFSVEKNVSAFEDLFTRI